MRLLIGGKKLKELKKLVLQEICKLENISDMER
jgi:hypothetical protein